MKKPDTRIKQLELIRIKVCALLEEKHLLEQQLENANKIIVDLEKKVEANKKEFEAVQKSNKMIKLAGVISLSDTERKELKKELRQYIQQIDDCIRMLSE